MNYADSVRINWTKRLSEINGWLRDTFFLFETSEIVPSTPLSRCIMRNWHEGTVKRSIITALTVSQQYNKIGYSKEDKYKSKLIIGSIITAERREPQKKKAKKGTYIGILPLFVSWRGTIFYILVLNQLQFVHDTVLLCPLQCKLHRSHLSAVCVKLSTFGVSRDLFPII